MNDWLSDPLLGFRMITTPSNSTSTTASTSALPPMDVQTWQLPAAAIQVRAFCAAAGCHLTAALLLLHVLRALHVAGMPRRTKQMRIVALYLSSLLV